MVLDVLKGLYIYNYFSYSDRCILNDVKKFVGD